MQLRCPIIPEPESLENTRYMPQLNWQGVIRPSYITQIQNMNIQQTAYWIWTIGFSKKWTEAEHYARTFAEHAIEGAYLEDLNHQRLENELHIMNHSHRVVILESIRFLSSNACVRTRSLDEYSLSVNTVQSSINTSYWDSTNEYDSSTDIVPKSERTRDKGNVWSEANSTSSSYPQAMSRRVTRLVLTPNKDSEEGCQLLLADIERKFRDNDYRVNVKPSDSHANRFIVTFYDRESVKRALNDGGNLGFHLEKRLQKRPTPKKPVKYRVLTRCLIRKGKSFKTKSNGYLKKDDIVLVNQLKNRRGRLVKAKDDGSYEAYGWVTVHTIDGLQLLEHVDEDE